MAAAYAAADLRIWPAVNEACGMSMLEAQAAGTAFVSCATRGVPDMVQDGITGVLSPSHDPQALAACARSLLSDVPRRRAMGPAARIVPPQRSLEQTATTLRELLGPWQPQVDTTGVIVATP